MRTEHTGPVTGGTGEVMHVCAHVHTFRGTHNSPKVRPQYGDHRA